MNKRKRSFLASIVPLLAATTLTSHAQLVWTVGTDDNGWPTGTDGGPTTSFVQENGAINPLPGSPFSTSTPGGADNDYYFAGEYTTVIAGNGAYDPVGTVDVNEEAAERAFAGGDNDLRYHFNLPSTLKPTDLLAVTFDILNLDGSALDPRYGIEVYFNGVKVQPEIVVRAAQIDKDYTTPQFTLASVNAQVGPGFDNIVSLRGVNYSGDGGGNWMGIDYVQLDQVTDVIPPATFPWSVGKDDNDWPIGDGGGLNATFVQENGAINPLPGNPKSPEVNGQADNDYYFAGSYKTVIANNGAYDPVGLVLANEEAAERAFAGGDNELRYHFNLPNNLLPTDYLQLTYEAMNLDTSVADPHYGVEVYFNNVLVQPELVVRPGDLNVAQTTARFSLASVKAEVGPGFDNIVSLKGINHSAEGGGNWMGFDYVKLAPWEPPIPEPVLPLAVGFNDNGWPTGNGGGANASFVQENGAINPLPGSPNSPELDQQADNDYYFAGVYTKVIAGNGAYTPVGPVRANEEAAERAFAGGDNDLRYHFNLPGALQPTDLLTVRFDAMNLDTSVGDPHYGVEVYFNGVKVQSELQIRPEDLNKTITVTPFTAASVNAGVGPGYDNILSLRGINHSTDGGGNWMGFDYVEIGQVQPAKFPWTVGKDDNGWPLNGVGGGANTIFVQENGRVNDLPGDPNSPKTDGQGDNDYYFAGSYTKVIPGNGDYTPIGDVFFNEEVTERAFTPGDNEMRFHFNLPSTMSPTDQVIVSFDANNLDTSGGDPRFGVEIYFNNVLVRPETVIHPNQLDIDYATAPFSLASVNAQVGPGYDNIITLKGIGYSSDGGGNWMGIDYVQLGAPPVPAFPWTVGMKDNGWPVGDGGGANATFVQENGNINPLPGNAKSPEIDQRADNDYYFAGLYNIIIPANGDYEPAGAVMANEEAAERAFAGGDLDLRYHFNLPATMKPTDKVAVSFSALNLDTSAADPRFGVEVYFNEVLVQPEITIRPDQLGLDFVTPVFTLASVNAAVGPGYDNIVSLKGVSYNSDGGGNWMGIDYISLNPPDLAPPIFLSSVVNKGQLTLDWKGGGSLEWAPTVLGPWTAVAPEPQPPYTEAVVAGQNRFYRLRVISR